MKRLTRPWIRKAEADFVRAERLRRLLPADHDGVCFNCQQSAEKNLKALLVELGQRVPHTHILRDLLALLLPDYPSLRSFRRGLRFLTRFAVGTRYPGFQASNRHATAALRWAARVRAAARGLLELPVDQPKRKKRRRA